MARERQLSLPLLAAMIFTALALGLLIWTMDQTPIKAVPPPLQPNNAPIKPPKRTSPNRMVMTNLREPVCMARSRLAFP
jgi:hypothetical protein